MEDFNPIDELNKSVLSNNDKIHIRIVKRNNRQSKTIIENLEGDLKNILRKLKIKLSCNGNIEENKILIFQGDQRQGVKQFLLDSGIISDEDNIIIHGY